jgi:hypothetical protein
MRNRRALRTLGLVVGSGLVGYLIGPPIVHAAANLVVIKDADGPGKAQVANGRLKVDTELAPGSGGTIDVNTEAGLDGFGRFRVSTGLPPSADDPDDAFSFVAIHEFDFTNAPGDGLVSQVDTSTHVNPCFNIDTPTVVTGVDISQSDPSVGGSGQLFRLQMLDVAVSPDKLMFEQFHPQGFHDDTGIVWSGASAGDSIEIKSFMRGAAGCSGDPCVPVTESFTVPIVVQGYCYRYPKLD